MSFLNNTQDKSTILVTGGATGIGLALAKRLINLGHTVIVSGRRQAKLDEAKAAYPALHTIQGDVETDAGRIELFEKVVKQYPKVNVLINNAGIANSDSPALKDTTTQDWKGHQQVLSVNLEAPIHLSILFLPHLLAVNGPAAIVNVSSVLAFVPFASLATYSATKAALHSFTLSLRHQTKGTNVQAIEIAPPGVITDMTPDSFKDKSADLDVYSDDTFAQLLAGNVEITHKHEQVLRGSRELVDQVFEQMNQ